MTLSTLCAHWRLSNVINGTEAPVPTTWKSTRRYLLHWLSGPHNKFSIGLGGLWALTICTYSVEF